MKKLYRKSTVHPSPPPPPPQQPPCTSPTPDQISLSFLPAAILTLAAALSSSDREVLAYLLSSSATPFAYNNNKTIHRKTSNDGKNDHAACFTCYCFTCYTSYWARWDSSPNRQLIHEIIDSFEEQLVKQRNNHKQGNVTRKAKRKSNVNIDNNKNNVVTKEVDETGSTQVDTDSGRVEMGDECGGSVGGETEEKQSVAVRKIVSFIGERIWGGIWG